MAVPKSTGIHHLRLTVSDIERSIKFYADVLGFEVRMRFGQNSALLHDGNLGLGLNTPWHEIPADQLRFDEARVGLDHIGFRVNSPDEVRQAIEHLDGLGIPHSGFKPGRLPESCLVVFRDPDNIQLEFYYSP